MTMTNPRKNYSIPEAFDVVRKQSNNDEKAKELLTFDSKAMRWFVKALYSKEFSFVGKVNYKPLDNPVDMQYQKINQAIPRIETLKKHKDKPSVIEKNAVLILESVSKSEAELLMKLFTGETTVDGITKHVFKKAYPEFFRNDGMEAEK